MELIDMYSYIDYNNIEFEFIKMKEANALYLNECGNECILLNTNLKTEREIKCTLIEEIAHREVGVIPTCIYSNNYFDKLQRAKNENRALKWAVKKLITTKKFKRYYGADFTLYEVAEELGITEDFLIKAYSILKSEI